MWRELVRTTKEIREYEGEKLRMLVGRALTRQRFISGGLAAQGE